jgi:glutamate---cysteine ligase / carboxylate-amine ligase
MPSDMPRNYSIGIEEEYFLIDAHTKMVAPSMPEAFLNEAKETLGTQVMPEFLQSQIEVVTTPHVDMKAVAAELKHLRQTVGAIAAKHGLAILAAGTHPTAVWGQSQQTQKERYDTVMNDLQMIGHRDMLCGMHVHVQVPNPDDRVDVMYRMLPYLPLFVALSTSSPFWQSRRTGLKGYRLAAYDELPRTGLPELFRTNEDYDEFVAALVGANIIPDASYIWWALRPSLPNPTIELRVADSCTRLDDAVAIAALFRCLVRALDRDREINAGFDRLGRAITQENKWHAQRYGIAATFIDPFARDPLDIRDWLDDVLALIADDVAALGCASEIKHLDTIVSGGTSASEQVNLFAKSRAAGRERLTAIHDVIDWAAAETQAVA